MTPFDPMAVAVDWLDAYRAARINQMVGMYSRDAVIECACGERKIIHGQEEIAAYWRDRFIASPALELEELFMDGGAVALSYRTSSGIVQALLDVTTDGLINRCAVVPRNAEHCRFFPVNIQF